MTILPSLDASGPSQTMKGHGGPNIKPTFFKDRIEIDFEHKAGSDDYIHIDLGQINLNSYAPGGYIEFSVDCSEPIVQAGIMISSPSLFWETRQTIEGLFPLKKGDQTYRLYMDAIVPSRRKTMQTDHVYLFLRDMKTAGMGKSHLTIRRIAFMPEVADWKKQRENFYAQQFPPFPDFERIEEEYREEFKRGVEWDEIAASPFLELISLDGKWKKKNCGEHFWDLAFLRDTALAQPALNDENWETVSVPEAPVADQAGGYYWYRKTFEVPSLTANGKVYLRCNDLSEDAVLYLNGKKVGTQSSVDKSLIWLGDGLGRTATPPGMTLADFMGVYFKRYEIPMPFDAKAIPADASRIAYPIATGQFNWPLAYDVTDLVKTGANTVAVRVHGNPLRGYWIYRHRDDRAAQNIFGILGSVTLATQRNPVLAEVRRQGPQQVDANGLAEHQFAFSYLKKANADRAVLLCEGQRVEIPFAGEKSYSAAIQLPARFTTYQAKLAVLDKDKRVLDERTLRFHGAVIGLKEGRLEVNGDPFLVRGICAEGGVEWKNDRHTSRREFLRQLRLYQQMGINTIRVDVNDPWHLQAAYEHGIMVLPILSNASCELSGAVFGRVEKPDIELALDRQRLGALLYRNAPNILMWNVGNEISHLPGRDDKVTVEQFLNKMPEIFNRYDSDRRLLVYSSYDAWILGWFFPNGDVVGWNHYGEPDKLAEDMKDPERLAAFQGKPYLFTEWGLDMNERKRDVAKWEKKMVETWTLKSTTKGCLGAVLYPWHGEMNEERGRAFIRSLFTPYSISREGGKMIFKNNSEAPMRKISIQVVKGTTISCNDWVEVLAPGESREIAVPPETTGTLEIRYESHHGLNHIFTEPL